MVSVNSDCPVCAHEQTSLISKSTIQRGTFNISRCNSCGVIYSNPRFQTSFKDLPLNYFQDDWKTFNPMNVSYQYNRFMNYVSKVSPSIVRKHENPTLLDVGSSTGYFLAHARSNNWNVVGVDPWKEASDWASKYLKINSHPVPFEEASIENDSVDAITLFDVISYVPNPEAILRKCFDVLKPGGIIHLTCWRSISEKYIEINLGSGHHQFSFTITGLEYLLEKVGFTRTNIISEEIIPSADISEIVVTANRDRSFQVSWADIAEDLEDNLRPYLDRKLQDETTLNEYQKFWRNNGYLILNKFIPHNLIDSYVSVRSELIDPIGWHSAGAYQDIEEIKDLALYGPLAEVAEKLIGLPMALHLVLTGWKSTTRDWHQDDYLNPPEVNSHYLAYWFALDDISPESGPFEFVPGSHRWPLIRQDKVLKFLPAGAADSQSWPWLSEEVLTPFFVEEIRKRNCETKQFLGKKGDVLIWHSNLLHRGSVPINPKIERRSLIAHLTGINHRNDMRTIKRHGLGGYYYDLKADANLLREY